MACYFLLGIVWFASILDWANVWAYSFIGFVTITAIIIFEIIYSDVEE